MPASAAGRPPRGITPQTSDDSPPRTRRRASAAKPGEAGSTGLRREPARRTRPGRQRWFPGQAMYVPHLRTLPVDLRKELGYAGLLRLASLRTLPCHVRRSRASERPNVSTLRTLSVDVRKRGLLGWRHRSCAHCRRLLTLPQSAQDRCLHTPRST